MYPEKKAVTLKIVATRVGLAPCSVSAILNHSEAARAIPQSTKDRVFRAATELNYQPNHWARSLRTRQTRMVAVLADLGRSAVAQVVIAAQETLHRRGYLLVLIASDSDDGRLTAHLQPRGVEGVIVVGSLAPRQLGLPVVSLDIDHPCFAQGAQKWLLHLGESAAEAIIRQIENPGSARAAHNEAKIPGTLFGVQAANLEFNSGAETAQP